MTATLVFAHCDFNNDGFDDLAIGVIADTVNGFSTAGAVQVLYGKSTGLSAANNQLWNAASTNVPGNPSNGADFGAALACGDFNGDGTDDLAIGAPNADSGTGGSVTVLYGTTKWRLSATKSQFWNQSGLGLPQQGRFGASVASGDFNGDGYADLAIGIPEANVQGMISAGAVLVLFGSKAGLSSSGSQFLTENSPITNAWYGYSLVSADFGKNTTSNCYDDLAIGAPGDGGSLGAVHVLYGSDTAFSNPDVQTWDAQSFGYDGSHLFGSTLAAGNFHKSNSTCAGKKISDLAIGAPYTMVSQVAEAGAVFILPADDSGFTVNGSQRWTQNSPGIADYAEKQDHFGAALAGGHNSTGDYLVIGVPGESVGSKVNAGVVHLLYVDSASGILKSNNSKLFTQNTTGVQDKVESADFFGAALATGDFDTNGEDDLAIGVPGEDLNGLQDVGALNVLYSAGTSFTQFFHQNGADMKGVEQTGDQFGASLSQSIANVVNITGTKIFEFAIPSSNTLPFGIAVGPDGNLWFTESGTGKIGRITVTGSITEFPIPTADSSPIGITAGPDGRMWFTEASQGAGKIGAITTTGAFTEFSVPTISGQPYGIAAGPDGNLWFTEASPFGNKIGRTTTTGSISEFVIPTAQSVPTGITAGPDGNLWFTEFHGNKIGRITTSGLISEFDIPTATSQPFVITVGPDNNLWFTENFGARTGKITTNGSLTELVSPGEPRGITTGPDGNLWVTGEFQNVIARITTDGTMTMFPTPTSGSEPNFIVTGPDGSLWFTEFLTNKIGKLVR